MSIHGVLGENTAYPKIYDPQILYPISRQIGRAHIAQETGFDGRYQGVDVWQAFELSWLNPVGVSQVAIARFVIPADSPNIVESKSLKLYLNSLNFTTFEDSEVLKQTLQADLSACVGADVQVFIMGLDSTQAAISAPFGQCIDDVLNHSDERIVLTEEIIGSLLYSTDTGRFGYHRFYSNLLRSNCPVTNQPDWGTLQVEMGTTYAVDFAAILRYILSFRQHNGFHEQCVERVFADFMRSFMPSSLKVTANYTRRGGIDINPVRVHNAEVGIASRLIRQ